MINTTNMVQEGALLFDVTNTPISLLYHLNFGMSEMELIQEGDSWLLLVKPPVEMI